MPMEEYDKVQAPLGVATPSAIANAQNQTPTVSPNQGAIFPYLNASGRLKDYDYYTRLFMGKHYEAFNIMIDSDQYNRAYSRLRYVMVNFAGLISKIVADMLFSEPLVVTAPDGDQEFLEELWSENQMNVQCYESGLSNSYKGDAILKVRLGPRRAGEDSTVIIEDITPNIYFPQGDPFNVRAKPDVEELAWTFKDAVGDSYLRREIHHIGYIENKVNRMDGDKIGEEVGLEILGDNAPAPMVETGIDRSLIIHIPNWKTGDRRFGISDYYDLDSLFYAVNNRMSKVDNVLDKHGDPILMVPPGVLNEKGQVNKKALGVIEVQDGENNKPEYIVWDASLENAFKEIEKLVEFIYLTGEISPDILGLGTGISDSGRALKFKLMRTIAKTARKKLYYDLALKEALYVAQLMAKKWSAKVNGVSLTKDPVKPEIKWGDGLPIDEAEQIDMETKAIDAGITTTKDAIMRVYGVDEQIAEDIVKDVKDEKAVNLPKMNLGGNNPFNKQPDNNNIQGQPGQKMPNNIMTK
jgi:hypothetical protein